MSIVLSILQIIGWILLAVLLLLIVALLILLFCPVHYLIEGEFLEEKWARFKVHWLLHLFRAKVSYGDDLIYGEIHVFWKKMTFSFDLTKKEEKEEDIEDSIYDDELEEALKSLDDDFSDEEESIETTDAKTNSSEKVIGTETVAELRGETEHISDVGIEDESDAESENNSENMEFKESVNDSESKENVNAEETLSEEAKESIVSKIKGIIERIKTVHSKIKKILTDERNQAAVKHLKDEVIYLIKILLPKKSKIDAVFSTGSPDTTGQLFGVLACFPALYKQDWNLLPDFEADEAYFKGTFWGSGRVSGYQLVGIVLRILFDKNCRRLYTVIKKFLKWLKKDDKSQEEK